MNKIMLVTMMCVSFFAMANENYDALYEFSRCELEHCNGDSSNIQCTKICTEQIKSNCKAMDYFAYENEFALTGTRCESFTALKSVELSFNGLSAVAAQKQCIETKAICDKGMTVDQCISECGAKYTLECAANPRLLGCTSFMYPDNN